MSAYVVYPFAEQGHFTPVHNQSFDHIMPRVSDSAWKVLSLIIRKTDGYVKPDGSRRQSYPLSYEDIKAGTGIKSDSTVLRALTELLSPALFGRPIILRQDAEKRGVSRREKTRYALNRNLKFALQKMECETSVKKPVRTPKSGAPKNRVREKVRTPKNGASRTPKNGGRKSAPNEPPIKNAGGARSNQRKNKESISLSAGARENDFGELKPDSTENAAFVEGETDARFETPHFGAVMDVCALDVDLIAWADKARAATVAAQLATKYTPDQIREAGARWEFPTAPHPRQLLTRIKALLSEPKNQNNHETHQRTSAPKFESSAERRERDLTENRDELFQRRADIEARKQQLADLETPCRGGWGIAGLATRD